MFSYYAINDDIKEENNCTNFSQGHLIGLITTNSGDYCDFLRIKLLWSGFDIVLREKGDKDGKLN